MILGFSKPTCGPSYRFRPTVQQFIGSKNITWSKYQQPPNRRIVFNKDFLIRGSQSFFNLLQIVYQPEQRISGAYFFFTSNPIIEHEDGEVHRMMSTDEHGWSHIHFTAACWFSTFRLSSTFISWVDGLLRNISKAWITTYKAWMLIKRVAQAFWYSTKINRLIYIKLNENI